jgi:hypothetical protein
MAFSFLSTVLRRVRAGLHQQSLGPLHGVVATASRRPAGRVWHAASRAGQRARTGASRAIPPAPGQARALVNAVGAALSAVAGRAVIEAGRGPVRVEGNCHRKTGTALRRPLLPTHPPTAQRTVTGAGTSQRPVSRRLHAPSAHLRVGRACRTTGPHPAHRHLPLVHRLAGQRSCPRRRWPSVAPAQAEATDRALDPSRARTGELTRSAPASTLDSRRRPLGDQHVRAPRPVSLRSPRQENDKGIGRAVSVPLAPGHR